MRRNASSMSPRWTRACSSKAPTRARSKAMVAPSGSCSSSVATSLAASITALTSPDKASMRRRVAARSASRSARTSARELVVGILEHRNLYLDQPRCLAQPVDAESVANGDHVLADRGIDLFRKARHPGPLICLFAGFGESAVDLRVGAHVVERAGKDRDRDRPALGAGLRLGL